MPISLDPDHTVIAHRRRASAPVFVTFEMAVVGVLLATGTLWIRATYGVWTIAEAPTRIELCHQSYTRLDDQPWTLAEATAHDATAGGALIIESTFGRLPGGLREPDRFAGGPATTAADPCSCCASAPMRIPRTTSAVGRRDGAWSRRRAALPPARPD